MTPRKPGRGMTKAEGQRAKRRVLWERARMVRGCLVPIMPQLAVGAALGISQQAVERIELVAIAKIIGRMAQERITEATAKG